MSQENVEKSSNAIAALNRDGVEGFLAYCDPAVEWITPPDWPEDRVLHGHNGVRRAIALFGEQFDSFRVDMEKVVDVDDDRVVVLLRQSGRIKGSPHMLEQPLGVATEFRDGKATRFQVYFSWDEALKAVGLEE
ncbi:MAG TPA: nuclear transport factor 2 family protein [Solirubrobacteraceae bacterium]|jgi:ketosteroid isomerase-like protein